MCMKSTVEEIRTRFDVDVERFSNLETGQEATIDAPLVMDLITEAASRVTPDVRDVLDIGCGAGNYSLKLLDRLPGPEVNVTLLDLSRPMLDRAVQRVGAAASGDVRALQGDIRDIDLGEATYDIIMAAAVQSMSMRRYGEYLTGLRDEAYRDWAFAYIEKEDTPRPLMYQIDLMRGVGFVDVDVLHKHGCMAAFGGVKAR